MKKVIWLNLLLFFGLALSAQVVDLSMATIVASKNIPSPVRETAIRVLKEEIAQLIPQIAYVSTLNCVDNLIGFLNRIWSNRFKALLEIPRAAGAWRP